jgi:hypothetical protein
MKLFSCVAVSLFTMFVSIAHAQDNSGIRSETFKGRPYSPYADSGFATEVYFGDTHVHTALSADAGGGGTTLLPRDAYRFARGEQVRSNTGQPVKLLQPLDFYMISDHSDGMGAITDIISGTANIIADPVGKEFHEAFAAGGERAAKAAFELTRQFSLGLLPEALNYQPGNPAFKRAWDDIVSAAEEFNEPGRFTTFIAFEWTSLVSGNNLHRVVLFRDGADKALQVEPYTTTPPFGSPNPSDLWAWMADYESSAGGKLLAIPHNGNLSNGTMFPLVDEFDRGKRLNRAYAESRQRWEPLYEATQIKGDGEAHPILSPDDEFADFETWDAGNLPLSETKTPEMLPGEYARSGLKRGLEIEARTGVNPYKFGLLGASDTHTGMTTPRNDNFFGKFTSYEPSPDRANHLSKENKDNGAKLYSWQYITPGLTAVWARENTRRAIFDAMMRKEVYATTGTRIRVRLFGGWEYGAEDALSRDLAFIGYSQGVPMGGDLTAPPEGAEAPSFLVYALRDPMGANLDRIQIVKGWLDDDGETHEKVYDVAWSDERKPGPDGKLPAVGSTVNLSIPSWTNTIGAAELGTVWQDPDFDPEERAFYYARVIEIPTPRWTAYDAVKFGLDLPDDIPLSTQERAYTSPIWYTP